jgi:topoisomerase-4 subunit A
LLIFPLSELPELSRGKGNKMLSIPGKRAATHEEYVVACTVLQPEWSLKILAGERHYTIKPRDFENFMGERGRRGTLLPQGLRRVSGLEVE